MRAIIYQDMQYDVINFICCIYTCVILLNFELNKTHNGT